MAIFREDEEARVRELLDALDRPVDLLVGFGPGETPLPGARDIDFEAEIERVVEGIAGLSERVTFRVEDEPAGFERYPAIAVLPDGEDVGIRYYGLPWGFELASLVGAVLEAGTTASSLHPQSLERLAGLDRDLTIDVFVTPTCPHCPPAVLLAYRAALASPHIRAAAIEATEFPALADSLDVWSVPRVVVNGVPHWDGTVPERVFVDRILSPAFE
jgi:glutaredoxin-like protein